MSASRRSSPRSTRSWAVIAASGPGARCGASSAHVCVLAATSGSGPSAKRPAPSANTPAAHCPGASSARRYSASDAAGHSCFPRSSAHRQRSRSSTSPSQSRVAQSWSTVRTSWSRSPCSTISVSDGPVTPSATDSGARTDRRERPASPRPPWPGAARRRPRHDRGARAAPAALPVRCERRQR